MLVEDEQRINAAYGELHHSLISVFTENEYLSSSNPFYVEAVMRQRIASSLDIPRLTTTVDSLMDCDFASLENTIKSVKAAVEASKKLISELLQSVPTESSTDSEGIPVLAILKAVRKAPMRPPPLDLEETPRLFPANLRRQICHQNHKEEKEVVEVYVEAKGQDNQAIQAMKMS